MARYTVGLRDMSNDVVRETVVSAEDDHLALAVAIRQWFGPHAYWHVDSGLGWGYGQVFETLPNRGNGFSARSRTGRASQYVVEDTAS